MDNTSLHSHTAPLGVNEREISAYTGKHEHGLEKIRQNAEMNHGLFRRNKSRQLLDDLEAYVAGTECEHRKKLVRMMREVEQHGAKELLNVVLIKGRALTQDDLARFYSALQVEFQDDIEKIMNRFRQNISSRFEQVQAISWAALRRQEEQRLNQDMDRFYKDLYALQERLSRSLSDLIGC